MAEFLRGYDVKYIYTSRERKASCAREIKRQMARRGGVRGQFTRSVKDALTSSQNDVVEVWIPTRMNATRSFCAAQLSHRDI